MQQGRHRKARNKLRHPPNLSPESWCRFVEFPAFKKGWKGMKLGKGALRALQVSIMADPEGAPVVSGTGGLRKIRFAPAEWKVGKSGAARIGYVYLADFSLVLLVAAYQKGRKENLTQKEKKTIKPLITEVKALLDDPEQREAFLNA